MIRHTELEPEGERSTALHFTSDQLALVIHGLRSYANECRKRATSDPTYDGAGRLIRNAEDAMALHAALLVYVGII